jgi:prepilin-type processing-associated H-X9-DG protein
MRERDRRGFALVEMATGVGVLLTLVALQLPALQRSRDAARRAQCTNNMKQLGLALHNYHAVNLVFPMSNVLGPGHGNGQSCFACLLPFMEQSPTYNLYNFHLEVWHDANRTTVGIKLATFICPANINIEPTAAADIRTHKDKPLGGKSTFAAGHYGANWGGVREASGAEAFKAYPGSHLGLILTVVDPDAKGKTRNISFADVTDGLSFTLAMVEKRSSFGWAVGGWGGSEFDVNTIANYQGDDAKLRRVFTGSYHQGGVNALMGDGSVSFLKTETEKTTWYALTTRAGGEVVKLN